MQKHSYEHNRQVIRATKCALMAHIGMNYANVKA